MESITDAIRKYLAGYVGLGYVRTWLIFNQWEASAEDKAIIDEADVAIAQMDDGFSSEHEVKARLSILAGEGEHG